MEYTLYRSKRKTIAIIIRDGAVIVRAPHYSSLKEIESFLASKEDWVSKKLANHRDIGVNENSHEMYVFGKKRRLIYKTSETVSFDYKEESIIIYGPLSMDKEKKLNKLENDLKGKLKQILDLYLDQYSLRFNIEKPPYKIRKYKRIHGRCSNQGELAFNTYLYEHSKEFIEYVVLHECAHLFEFNHSKRFYQIIQEFMPNYKEIILAEKTLLSPHQDQ